MKSSSLQPVHLKTARRRPRKCFDVSQAGRSLVLVRRIVADVVRAHSQLDELQETIEAAQASGRRSLVREAHGDILRAAEEIRSCMAELRDVGAELTDWSHGSVDFPAVVNEREVRLCWRLDEPHVRHWHDAGQTCAERRPVQMHLSSTPQADG